MLEKITVYGENICEEIILPTISEARHVFKLDKKAYGLKEDINVAMQVMDGSWCFSESSKYSVLRNKELCFLRKIYAGDILNFEDGGGGELLFAAGTREDTIPVYRKLLLDKKKKITFGRTEDNDIVLTGSRLISRKHGALYYENTGWILEDKSHNGIYVNGERIRIRKCLLYGDVIEIFGCRFVFLKEILAVQDDENHVTVRSDAVKPVDKETLKWLTMIPVMVNHEEQESEIRPAPKMQADYDTEEFEIEAPPAPRKMPERSLFMTMGPSLTMAVPMLLGLVITGMGVVSIGLITMAGSAVIGAFWAYMHQKKQKEDIKKEEEQRCQKYREYLREKEEKLKKAYAYNEGQLRKMYPPASECVNYTADSPGLWNRNISQSDYLFIRLGEGEEDFQKPIRIPQERFSIVDDSLADEPARIKRTYEKLRNVPVCVDFQAHSVIGIIGGYEKYGAYSLLQTIIVQIAANFSASDVKLVFLCDGEKNAERKLLENIKWLPHLWNDDKTVRYAGDTKETVSEAVNCVCQAVKKRLTMAKEQWERLSDKTHYVIAATSPVFLETTSAEVFLKAGKPVPGVTLLLCAENFSQLPNVCEFILQNTNDFSGMYSVRDDRKNWKPVRFDTVTPAKVNTFSHRLAAVRVKKTEVLREIPAALTFFDMYHVENAEELQIEKRWQSGHSYTSMSVPIGARGGGQNCFLDIHENAHGPHGLAAGTTGSGKSELLLTWILSLAVNFSPEDAAFFLIDFKGGGMAAHVEALPHISGVITNLSESQVHRALVSVRSEIESRQSLFVRVGANDIYEYTRLYKNREAAQAVPHLMIVVDEFAELKKEYPEFMNELISVAAVGRSLGIHLILATQKPAGTVDDKIQSNSRFRICLKVQDRQDSRDMLGREDAAFIRQKGRGYFKVGNDEIYEQFQSAWSRAPYAADSREVNDNLAKLYTVNGKTEIVGNYQKLMRRENERIQWAESLLECIRHVLLKTECAAGRYLADEKEREKVNQCFYRYFSEKGWNIEQSEYNSLRLLDMMIVYDFCVKNNGDISAGELLAAADTMHRSFVEAGRKTQLNTVVDEIRRTAEKLRMMNVSRLWLPKLPAYIYLEAIQTKKAERGTLEACIGKYDNPKHQCQGPVYMDFLNQGNYLICGSVGAGKSTLLQTLIYSLITDYTPEQVNIYGLDFGSRMLEGFEKAPHVGGILYEQNAEKIEKFFFLMKELLAERKEKLKGGTFSQYLRAGGKDLPAVIIVIDQYGTFREKTDNKYDSIMLELAKDGNSHGIFIVVSAGGILGGEIPSKFADNLKGRLSLHMNDRYTYRDVLNMAKTDVFPEEDIKGRGLAVIGGEVLEYQTALAMKTENDYERMEKIERLCRRLRENASGVFARAIPEIPKNPVCSVFLGRSDVKALLSDDRSLPLGYDLKSAAPWSLDMSQFYCYIVSGKKRSGKTNFLLMAAAAAAAKGGKLYMFGDKDSLFERTAKQIDASFYSVDDDLVPFCTEIKPELVRRNQKKHELEISGFSDEEIYEAMKSEKNIFIFIDDLAKMTQRLYEPEEGHLSAAGFFETFTDKGWYHQIFIFAALNQDDRFLVSGRPFYENVIRDGNGIHFGGNAGGQHLLNFDYMTSFKEQNQTEPVGVGILAVGEGRLKTGKAVIPAARK